MVYLVKRFISNIRVLWFQDIFICLNHGEKYKGFNNTICGKTRRKTFFFFEKVVYIKYLFVSSNILNLESNHVT